MISALFHHWPEYLCEAILLGLYMVSACLFAALLFHPASWVAGRVRNQVFRRVAMGVAMGATGVTLIYSPIGQRSGAHMNPGATLAYLSLGKIAGWDAMYYMIAQFFGGAIGVKLAATFLPRLIRHPSVNHVPTLPGRAGVAAAWFAEFVIAFILLSVVLRINNAGELTAYTGFFAGAMVALFIMIEAPISGMSMNPARTLASSLWSGQHRGLWIYFTAPPLAMLAAAALYTSTHGPGHVYCAKMKHPTTGECIFDCHYLEMPGLPDRHAAKPAEGARIQGVE